MLQHLCTVFDVRLGLDATYPRNVQICVRMYLRVYLCGYMCVCVRVYGNVPDLVSTRDRMAGCVPGCSISPS